MASKNYQDMTVKELEDKARDAGISGFSSMKKDELVEALEKQLPSGKSSQSSGSKSSGSMPGVLSVLKQEHDEVKALFEKFEKQAESDLMGTQQLATKIMDELMRHAEMEEQIVYPGLQEEDSDVYHEAHEEHHVAEMLIGELRGMKPDDTYKAKMMVLAENVRHHIEEEETEGFEQLRKLPQDRLAEMGQQWEQTKMSWKPSAARSR